MTMNMYSVLIYKSNACNLREYTITYLLTYLQTSLLSIQIDKYETAQQEMPHTLDLKSAYIKIISLTFLQIKFIIVHLFHVMQIL